MQNGVPGRTSKGEASSVESSPLGVSPVLAAVTGSDKVILPKDNRKYAVQRAHVVEPAKLHELRQSHDIIFIAILL